MGTEKQNNNLFTLKGDVKTLVNTEFKKFFELVSSEEDQKKKALLFDQYSEFLSQSIVEKVDNPMRDKKLEILYNHEKHFLDILKDYKEEIKFAASLQAEIRKEQATFFSSTLKEVCTSLKDTQVDQKCQVQWIFDLVESYTSSLKLSSKLAEEHVISLLGNIQDEATKTINEEK